jgi:hypothetical protein
MQTTTNLRGIDTRRAGERMVNCCHNSSETFDDDPLQLQICRSAADRTGRGRGLPAE